MCMPGPSRSDSGAHVPENLTAYSYLKTSCFTEDRQNNHHVFEPIIGHKLWKEYSKDKVDAGFWLSMPKNLYNILFVWLYQWIWFSLKFFRFQFLVIFPYFKKKGTTAEFPALSSSHNFPCNDSRGKRAKIYPCVIC